MVLAHGRLKVGGRQMLWMSLMGTPLHKPAVGDPAEEPHHEHGRRTANPAAVIIVRNVQPLVQAIFNAPKTSPIELQPLLGVELCWGRAGQQDNVFVPSAFGLAQQSGGLRRQRKANLLRRNRLGLEGAAHHLALFVSQGAELSRGRFPRGENPPWGRGAAARYAGARWADCL